MMTTPLSALPVIRDRLDALSSPGQHAVNLHLVPEDVMLRKLDTTGPHFILDLISAGYMAPEIAEMLTIRATVLDRWMRANLDPSDVVAVRRIAAARYRAQARQVLEQFNPKAEDRTMLNWRKAMRDEYASLAAVMDPGDWNPAPNQQGATSIAAVTINMPDPYSFGGVSTQQVGAVRQPTTIEQTAPATPAASPYPTGPVDPGTEVNSILQLLHARRHTTIDDTDTDPHTGHAHE